MICARNLEFIEKHAITKQVVPFKDLPQEARFALIVYLADSWEVDFGEETLQQLREHQSMVEVVTTSTLKKYENEKFGYATIKMADIKKQLMRDEDLKEFKSFTKYHDWYLRNCKITRHKTVWPTIMSCFEHELFEDGWHRFHSYVEDKVKVVPVVWFTN